VAPTGGQRHAARLLPLLHQKTGNVDVAMTSAPAQTFSPP
jgi:hypothetical protein